MNFKNSVCMSVALFWSGSTTGLAEAQVVTRDFSGLIHGKRQSISTVNENGSSIEITNLECQSIDDEKQTRCSYFVPNGDWKVSVDNSNQITTRLKDGSEVDHGTVVRVASLLVSSIVQATEKKFVEMNTLKVADVECRSFFKWEGPSERWYSYCTLK